MQAPEYEAKTKMHDHRETFTLGSQTEYESKTKCRSITRVQTPAYKS